MPPLMQLALVQLWQWFHQLDFVLFIEALIECTNFWMIGRE